MASFYGFLKRNWQAQVRPPAVAKSEQALKFGILGAANIGPMALFTPAKTHPEVVLYCVAARVRSRAEAYAKANRIAEVRDTYQDVLDDPAVDVVYVPLPNALHFEWAVRAVRAGKHVLLEKPAAALFALPELRANGGSVVLMEAFHYRFTPAWEYFRRLLAEEKEEAGLVMHHVQVTNRFFKFLPDTDIRFDYDLAGGATMDFGTYGIAALRHVAGEPAECLVATMERMAPPRDKVDRASTAKWKMQNGATAETLTNMSTPYSQFRNVVPTIIVSFKPVNVDDPSLPAGQTKTTTRELRFLNYLMSSFWHRVDIEDSFTVTESEGGKLVKSWSTKESKTVYKPSEAGLQGVGEEDYWTTYRHQLEEFVNRVKGRPTAHWVEGEDTVNQMKALGMIYEKSGLGPRPSTKYFSSGGFN